MEPEEPGTTSATSGGGGSGGDASPPLPTPNPRPEPSTPRPRPEVCEVPLAPPVDWWTFDDHTFACCTESLAAAIPTGDLTPWIEASFDDLDTQNCCTQITSPNMDALWSGQPPPPAPDGVLPRARAERRGDVHGVGTADASGHGQRTGAWLALGDGQAHSSGEGGVRLSTCRPCAVRPPPLPPAGWTGGHRHLARAQINEARSRRFAGLADQLSAAAPIRPRAAFRVADEECHARVLCGAVVEGSASRRWALSPTPRLPAAHAEVAPMEGALRNGSRWGPERDVAGRHRCRARRCEGELRRC